MKMNNITLIGMPGAGKSTLGVVLAKILGYEFLDSDLLIQKEEKRRLYQIIDEEGEEGFKTIENRVNASIDTENTVIATGGSVVYCSEAMEHLKSIGKVVYLSLSLESLEKRLGNLKKRGVLLKEGQTLKSLYEERVPLYEKYADIVVDEEGKDLEASLQALLETLQTGLLSNCRSLLFAECVTMNEVNSNCKSEEGCRVIGEKLTIAFLAHGVRIIEVYYGTVCD